MADLLVEVGPVKSPHYRLEAVRQLGYKPRDMRDGFGAK
jgi:hypothetical protein